MGDVTGTREKRTLLEKWRAWRDESASPRPSGCCLRQPGLAPLGSNPSGDLTLQALILCPAWVHVVHNEEVTKNGAPGGIRTPDQQDRNLLLYPAELQAHNGSVCGQQCYRSTRRLQAHCVDPRVGGSIPSKHAKIQRHTTCSRNEITATHPQEIFSGTVTSLWSLISFRLYHDIERIPRHFGYREQPQNACPAFAPRRAIRLTIASPHLGHKTISDALSVACNRSSGSDCPALRNILSSFWPSIRPIAFPDANERASSVKPPEVTINPPFAPRSTMIPNNSRTTDTPTR